VEILVNNAGVAHVGTVESTSEADLDRIYRVNVKGVFLCTQAAVPIMLRRGGGVILNMASIAALIGIEEVHEARTQSNTGKHRDLFVHGLLPTAVLPLPDTQANGVPAGKEKHGFAALPGLGRA